MDSDDLIYFLDSCIEYSREKSFNYNSLSKEMWLVHAYERWALNDIKKMIKSNPKVNLIWQLETYRDMMDDYACKAVTGEANMLFLTAYDTATDVLDWLIVYNKA